MGDVRAAGDLGDGEGREPFLGDDRGGGVDDPLALAFDDELAWQVAAPARQPALGAPRPLGGERRDRAGGAAACRRRGLEPGGQAPRVARRPRRQFVGEPGQLARATFAQARGGHLADAAEDRLDGQVRRLARGSTVRGLARGPPVAADVDAPLELREHARAPLERPCPRAEGPEHQQRGRLGLGCRQLRPRAHRHDQALLAGPVDIVGLHDRAGAASRDLLVGAQEQVFLVGIEAVEGRLGDVRELGQIDDPHRRISLLGNQLDHRLL